MNGKPVSESRVTLTQLMGVTDANTLGNVHGGIIMKLCDEAGALASMRHARHPVVTITVDSMTFHWPVHIGNLVTARAEVTWTGHTSLEARVVVTAEDLLSGRRTHTNTAFFVYVALDEHGKPTPVPPLILETDDERQFFEDGAARRERRLQRRDLDRLDVEWDEQ